MKRPPRPSDKHVWDKDHGWLSPAELRDLTLKYYDKLASNGFEDAEHVSRKTAKVSRHVMAGKTRSVNLKAYLKSRGGELPDDWSLETALSTPISSSEKAERLRRRALRAFIENRPWEECLALALLSAGFSQRQIEKSVRIGRPRIKQLLLEALKEQ